MDSMNKQLLCSIGESLGTGDSESVRTFVDEDMKYQQASAPGSCIPDGVSVITFNQEDSCANISILHHGGGAGAIGGGSSGGAIPAENERLSTYRHPFSTAKATSSQLNFSMSSEIKGAEKSFGENYTYGEYGLKPSASGAGREAYIVKAVSSSAATGKAVQSHHEGVSSLFVRSTSHAHPQNNDSSYMSLTKRNGASVQASSSYLHHPPLPPPPPPLSSSSASSFHPQLTMNTTYDSIMNGQSTSQLIEPKRGVYFRKTQNHFGSVAIGSLTRSKIELCNATDKEVKGNTCVTFHLKMFLTSLSFQ